jgi:hypothetical protein
MPPDDAAYYRLVTSDATGPIDLSLGRAQLIDGDIFFSPNSRREVQRPNVYTGIPSRDSKVHLFSEFLEPQWWLSGCPYLPFVPMRPVYAGVPFQNLFNISLYFPRCPSGFYLDPQYIVGWAHVQKHLKDSINGVLGYLPGPPLTWIASSALGCGGFYSRSDNLRRSVVNSRLWFSQWMAGLTYAIAISKTFRNESLDETFPHWFSRLSEQRFKQVWLSGLNSSQVSTFSPSVDRVGVFLQLIHPNREQPSVDWFCRFHVPVWYPWGRNESEASRSNQRLARFAPTPYQLQQVATFLTRTPEPPSMPEPSSSNVQPSISREAFDCELNVSCSDRVYYIY